MQQIPDVFREDESDTPLMAEPYRPSPDSKKVLYIPQSCHLRRRIESLAASPLRAC